jgi:hypothetical protein
LRQPRSYGALNETHREVDEQQNSAEESRQPSRQPRNYEALRETQYQVDDQRNTDSTKGTEAPGRLEATVQRSWTPYGDYASHQDSANKWHQQDLRIKMAQSDRSGADRAGEGPQPNRDQTELQEARAIAEEARKVEQDRARQREHDAPER